MAGHILFVNTALVNLMIIEKPQIHIVMLMVFNSFTVEKAEWNNAFLKQKHMCTLSGRILKIDFSPIVEMPEGKFKLHLKK
jgi:hypothetical protein